MFLIYGKLTLTLKTKEDTSQGTITINSTSYELRDTISTWYKGLRAVALVGLLSVLVYVGIRIIISSTGQEKAKYKKMISDWLVAICILFVLHYIMAFTMTIVEEITGIFSVNTIGENGEDMLMSSIRNNINSDQYSGLTTFINLILYLVLVGYTVMFTIHYLKRLAYLAFFTMIAPLIALTYPIDKIKDGQAQAFSMWIREYVFNALIPVVHIVIYSIFVGSAIDFAQSNPLYAIVCIGFLLTAEKFFKKMFGFDKATTSSQLGAAAGGALFMNAINKMGHRRGKQAAEKAGGTGGAGSTRTASANSVTIGSGNGGGNSAQGGSNSTPSSQTPTLNEPTPMPTNSSVATGGTQGSFGTERNASIFGPTLLRAIKSPRGIRNGLNGIGRRYINANTAKKVGRMARRGLVGAAGAATLGAAGIIAGAATGDFSNTFKYAGAGALAGYWGANNIGDKVVGGGHNLKETFYEGAIGQNEYNNLKADKEFYNSQEFRSMVNNQDLLPGITGLGRTAEMRNILQTYRDNGVTDTGKIATAMKTGLTPQEGAYAIKLANIIGRNGWNNPNTRKDFEARYKNHMPAEANVDKIWNSIESLL